MKSFCYLPSLNGKLFIKENLINELKKLSRHTKKESFIVGLNNGIPVFADKVEIEDVEFIELS